MYEELNNERLLVQAVEHVVIKQSTQALWMIVERETRPDFVDLILLMIFLVVYQLETRQLPLIHFAQLN